MTTLGGKRDDFTLSDFNDCGKLALLKRGEAKRIVEEVRQTVARWCDYADEIGVSPEQRDKIQNALRLKIQ